MIRRVGKFNNRFTKLKGSARPYHSKREAIDAFWLKGLEKKGEITDLREQVRFDLIVNGKKLKKYALVDFQFQRNGKTVWYETKGFPTQYWSLKKDIIEATLPEGHVYLVNAGEKDVLNV